MFPQTITSSASRCSSASSAATYRRRAGSHDPRQQSPRGSPRPRRRRGRGPRARGAAGINGADMMQLRGRYPAPPGSPADIPGLEFAGEVAALGPGRSVSRRRPRDGDPRWRRRSGARGRARAPADAGPDRSTGPAAGGLPEVFPTAHDALFTQARAPLRRAPAGPWRSGRGRDRSVQLGRMPGRRSPRPSAATEQREALAALGADAIAPEGFTPARPLRPDPGARRRAEPRGEHRCARDRRPDLRDRRHRRRERELNLLALMGKRARIYGSTLRARPLEEKALCAAART